MQILSGRKLGSRFSDIMRHITSGEKLYTGAIWQSRYSGLSLLLAATDVTPNCGLLSNCSQPAGADQHFESFAKGANA